MVRRHVGHGAVAEVPHPSPDKRRVLPAVGPRRPWAKPEVPVETGGLGGRTLTRTWVLDGPRIAAPAVHFAYGTNRAVGDPLYGLAMPLARAAVVAHLRRDFRFLRDACHEAGLPDVVRERFLAVDVLAGLHRQDRDVGMEVVGRGDEDGVDRRFLLEHDAEVFVRRALVVRRLGGVVLFNLRFHRPAARLAGVVPVRQIPLLRRIGERDDLAIVFLEEGARIGPALSAGADDRHVHLVTGRDEALAAKPAKNVAGHDGEPGRGGGRRFDELSARGRRLLVHVHPPRRRRLTWGREMHT